MENIFQHIYNPNEYRYYKVNYLYLFNMESAKSKKNDKLNSEIRQFFPTTNKRILKVIEPYLNEIDDNNYKLRERKIVDYKAKFEPSDHSEDGDDRKDEKSVASQGEVSEDFQITKKKKKLLNKKRPRKNSESISEEGLIEQCSDDNTSNYSANNDDLNDPNADYIELTDSRCLAKAKTEAIHTIYEAETEINRLEKEFYINESRISENKSRYPDFCIPICSDIREFKFKQLAEKQKELTGQLFDAIMMDPPWQLSSSQPTRGVAIAYDTLADNIITDIPVEQLQTDGFIFIWTINAKFKVTLDLIKGWGYRYCDEIVWIKQTVNGKIAKGHGYYLQHTKETCLIGIKGNPKYNKDVMTDVIFSKRRGQSQKPEEVYDIIEGLIPNGYYLEIFGRRNNLRNYWVTIGNEI
jgi:mRNA (2'-O-methyladenosine-N6-)-methyltransferase